MSVPFTQQATEALYIHSKELADLISSNVAIIGVLGARGRIEIIEGGLGWRERVYYGTSPNAGHRSRYTQVPTNRMENMTMASYDGAFYSDSIVVNKVDVAEAKGEAALGDLVKDSWEVAKTYAVKQIATDLWASSKASDNHPLPLPVMLKATAATNAAGTDRGGISSADNDWWRNQLYTTTIADLGAAAGLRTLEQYIHLASRSAAKVAQPDFGLTTSALYTRITSTMDSARRFIKDEAILKLGFEHVMFLNMAILWDALCATKQFYGLNTRSLKIKCLKMPNMQNINVNQNQYSLPMVIEPMRDDIDTVNNISLMYLKYALVCSDLAGQFRLTDCTE